MPRRPKVQLEEGHDLEGAVARPPRANSEAGLQWLSGRPAEGSDAKSSCWADVAKIGEKSSVVVARVRVKGPELVDDCGGGLDGRILRQGSASPPKGKVLGQSGDAAGDVGMRQKSEP